MNNHRLTVRNGISYGFPFENLPSKLINESWEVWALRVKALCVDLSEVQPKDIKITDKRYSIFLNRIFRSFCSIKNIGNEIGIDREGNIREWDSKITRLFNGESI